MNIYILLIAIIILLVIAYYSCKRDIMAPSVLLTSGYLLSCISCIYNIDNWRVELHFLTCFIIVFGIVCFQIGDYLYMALHKSKLLTSSELVQAKEIKIPLAVVWIFTLYNLFVLYLSLQEILKMAGGLQATIGSTVGIYRYAYSFTEFRANSLNVQLLKISKGSAYTFLYIFVNNLVINKKDFLKNIKYLVPVVTYAFITLIKGGRISAIMLLIAALFITYFLLHKKVGWNKNISFKFIQRIFIAFVAFTFLFFGTRELVGRRETTPFFEYLTTYIGGSYQLLDQYLEDRYLISDNIETFPGIVQSLEKIGIVSESYHKALEFRYSVTGIYLGNVYTGLRRYYHDFGFIGIAVIQIIYGYLFSFMHSMIKKMRYLNSNRLFFLTTYASLLFCIITQSIEDHFWIDLSLGFVIELVVCYFVTKIIMDYRITGMLKIRHTKWSENNSNLR